MSIFESLAISALEEKIAELEAKVEALSKNQEVSSLATAGFIEAAKARFESISGVMDEQAEVLERLVNDATNLIFEQKRMDELLGRLLRHIA